MRNIKKLTVLISLTLLFSQQLMAKSRVTVLEDKEGVNITESSPVLLGKHLLFQTTETDGVTLWALDTENNNQTKLFGGTIENYEIETGFNAYKRHLLRNGDLVFFIAKEGDTKQLWRTDGSPEGTRKLDSVNIYREMKSDENLVMSQSQEGHVVVTDGEQVVSHKFNFPSVHDSCAFGLNDVITLDYDMAQSASFIRRSKNGEVTDIPLPFDNRFFTLEDENTWRMGDVCYYGLVGYNISADVLMVSESGDVKLLSDTYDTSGLIKFFNFNGQIFALESKGTPQLVRFNADFTSTDTIFSLSSAGQFITDINVINDHLTLNSSTNTSPPLRLTYYYDKDLQLVEGLGGSNHQLPDYYQTSGEGVYIKGSKFNILSSVSLSNEIGMDPVLIKIQNDQVNGATSHEDQPSVYLLTQDKVTLKSAIERLSDQPGIGDSINGIWHDPEIENQGISVHTGERLDGSKYVFVTIYTFKNGQPLWLAGASNIEHPQTSIEVLLGDYKGSNMFETNITPEVNVFGRVVLKMTACNQLEATVTSDTSEFRLNLSRIDNISYNHLCSE